MHKSKPETTTNTTTTPKNKGGRPLKDIDPKQVVALAKIGCTNVEIAEALDCSHDTLETRFSVQLKKGRAHVRQSLRRRQLARAEAGSDTMLIWLGKQLLGQKDKSEVTGQVSLIQVLDELDKLDG